MPTPSEPTGVADWRALPAAKPRSVFGNFAPAPLTQEAGAPAFAERTVEQTGRASTLLAHYRSASEPAVARSFLYRFLAKAYEDPQIEGWRWLCADATHQALQSAAAALGASDAHGSSPPPLAPERPDESTLAPAAARLRHFLREEQSELFHNDYLAAFGHAARGRCPLNEIEYGDIKADPLFQPHRLADLAAFYRAFGLELTEDAAERQDHICLELEFMSVLAAKEAYALENRLGDEALLVCREAQKKFLREHLGRWTPAFTRRLGRMTAEGALEALAQFTHAFVQGECRLAGVLPGSEDLLLRPVDEAAESLCASCGLPRPEAAPAGGDRP